MATFGVSVTDEINKRLNDQITQVIEKGVAGSKGEALQKIFEVAAAHSEDEELRRGGVDTDALDATLSHLRTMYADLAGGKEQIRADAEAKYAVLKAAKDAQETELRAQIATAKQEAEAAKVQAEAATHAASKAVQESEEAKKQAQEQIAAAKARAESAASDAESAKALAAEKDKTIASITAKLTEADEKAQAYNDLMQKKQEADAQIRECAHEIENLKAQVQRNADAAKKDRETALRELQAQMDRSVSDTKKDAALEKERAVQEAAERLRAEKDAALDALRSAKDAEKDAAVQAIQDRYDQQLCENARLQAKTESQAEQIKELKAQIAQLQGGKET